jgi:hypothetical protein
LVRAARRTGRALRLALADFLAGLVLLDMVISSLRG